MEEAELINSLIKNYKHNKSFSKILQSKCSILFLDNILVFVKMEANALGFSLEAFENASKVYSYIEKFCERKKEILENINNETSTCIMDLMYNNSLV